MVQGAEAGSDFTHPATMVFAQWQLPEVPAIIPNDDMIAVAFWVGLDGYSQLDGPAATQVLQGGVVAQVELKGWWLFKSASVNWYAWAQWMSAKYTGQPGELPI